MNFSTPISIIPICTNAMEMFAWPKQMTYKSFYISQRLSLGEAAWWTIWQLEAQKKTSMSPSNYTHYASLHFYTSSFILLSSLTIVILNIFLTYEELWIFASMKTFSHWSLLSFPSDSLLTWKFFSSNWSSSSSLWLCWSSSSSL